MNLKFLSLAMLILVVAACNNADQRTLAPEAIFDGQGQQVITSFFNKKKGTITTLYGNEMAQNAAAVTGINPSETSSHHVAGEVFTMVISKQEPNPYWYGSNINTGIESIEEVRVVEENHQLTFNYTILKEGGEHSNLNLLKKQERIDLILNQKASVFP